MAKTAPPALDGEVGGLKAKEGAQQPATLRDRLLAWVESGSDTVAAWQAWFGVRGGKPTNPFWHAVFTVGATFGNEIFFITFLPFVFWCWDQTVGRRLINMWCCSYYTGQLLKDTLKLPRPEGGRVVRLERHYEHEYGMPSTHAMNALAMPALMVLASAGRYTGSWVALVSFAVFWFLSCTFSRLYLGVHSPADLWVGLAHGAAMLGIHLVYGEAIDHFVLSTPYLWLIAIVLTGIAALAYPRPDAPTWVSTPGDTVLIVASSAGIAVACNFAAEAHVASSVVPFEGPDLHTPAAVGLLLAKLGVGFGVLMGTRAVAKAACMAVLPRLVSPAYGPADDASIRPELDAQRWKEDDAVAVRNSTDADGKPLPPPEGSEHGDAAAGLLSACADVGMLLSEVDRVVSSAAAAASEADESTGVTGVRKRGVGGGAGAVATTAVGEGGAGNPLPSAPSGRALSSRGVSGGADDPKPPALHPSAASPTSRRSAGSPTANSGPGPGRVLIPAARRYAVELPTKIVTYGLVGFNAMYTVPVLFQYLGWAQYGIPMDGWQQFVRWWL